MNTSMKIMLGDFSRDITKQCFSCSINFALATSEKRITENILNLSDTFLETLAK